MNALDWISGNAYMIYWIIIIMIVIIVCFVTSHIVMKKRIEYLENWEKNIEDIKNKKNLENLEKCLKEAEDWRTDTFKGLIYINELTSDENREFIRNKEKIYQDKIDECYRKYGKK